MGIELGTAVVAGSAISGGLNMITGGMAAQAQGKIAEEQLKQQRADRNLALAAAEPSPEEVAQLNKAISLNEADIVRKQKLLDSADPALIEAGSQALKLLRGEEAKTLGPLKNNIAKQEQKLRERLQAQLGPGWESSTAGQQALAAFNEQANNAVSGAQQATLGQLLGVAQDTASRYGTQNNIANSASLSQAFGRFNERKISAIHGTPITASGAQFVGDLQNARNMQSSINSAISGGTMMYALGGGFKGLNNTAGSGSGGSFSFDPASGTQMNADNFNPAFMNG